GAGGYVEVWFGATNGVSGSRGSSPVLKLSTLLCELHLHEIPRVAIKTAQKLAQGAAAAVPLGDAHQATVEDLIHYLPMRYEDRSKLAPIRDLQNGMWATIEVAVRI